MLLGGVVLAMAVVLTGCPTPPPGYQPPSLESTQITPQPAQPGDTVTMLLDVRDDQALTAAVAQRLYTPSNTVLSNLCETEMAPQGDFRHVLVTVTCAVPTFASNGTWQLDVFLNDSSYPTANYPGRTVRIPFEVTGGSDDRRPPQLLSYSIAPTTVDQATKFTVTALLRDESFPVTAGFEGRGSFTFVKPFSPNSMFFCGDTTVTPISGTDVEVVSTCTPSNYSQPGRSEPGLHVSYLQVQDALGHEGNAEMVVDVRPAP